MAPHTSDRVGERGVREPHERDGAVGALRLDIEAVPHARHSDRLVNGRYPGEEAEVGRRRVPRVDREELALDVGGEVVDEVGARDARGRAREGPRLDRPLAERLDAHVEAVGRVGGRHDAVHRRIGEDGSLERVVVALQGLRDRLAQSIRGLERVLARHDDEGRRIVAALAQCVRDDGRDEAQDGGADGGRGNVSGRGRRRSRSR